MTISWNIPIERPRRDDGRLTLLAQSLMSFYDMDEDEYSVHIGRIEGSPDALRFNRLVTPFRVAVYDVTVISDDQHCLVNLRFRLYKGIAVAMMVWFVNSLLFGSIWKWESLLLPVLSLVLFNGIAALSIISTKRRAFEIVQRWSASVEKCQAQQDSL